MLTVIQPDSKYCGNCIQQPIGRRFIPADGSGSNKVLLLGDSPWTNEIASGKNFAGAAGYTLDRLLRRAGYDRANFLVANSLWCKPPTLNWTDQNFRPEVAKAFAQCAPYLDDLVAQFKPRVVVPMGNVALRRSCGVSGIESRHSYVHETVWGIPAIPTFHPSYIMQGNQKMGGAFVFALRRAMEAAKGALKPTKYELLLDPPIDKARAYLNRIKGRIPALVVDIETPESAKLNEDDDKGTGSSYHIIRAGFSHTEGTAITFPWTEPWIGLLQEALDRSNTMVEWTDKEFDSRRLRAAGLKLPTVVSAMWMWHWLQSDLPKALGFVAPFYYIGPAWKHMASAEPAQYNALDNAIEMTLYNGIKKDIEKRGSWERFWSHCVQTTPVLRAMEKAGVLLDKERQSDFMGKLKVEYDAEYKRLQGLVPVERKPLHPKKGYKKTPKVLVPFLEKCPGAFIQKPISLFNTSGITPATEHVFSDATYRSIKVIDIVKVDGKLVTQEVERWAKVMPFNPGSWKQVADFARLEGIKLPMVRKPSGEEKESTEAKYLKRIANKRYRKDEQWKGEVFKSVLDCRKKNKLLTSYNWQPADDDRIHTSYGYHPSTWRKSSRGPNMQTIPKRVDLAEEFRKMFVAAPGHLFVAVDSEAIEAVLVGYWAGSKEYIELAKAGIHGWLASHVLKEPIPLDIPFDELRERCREFKHRDEKVYDRCKRVTHLTNYLGTAQRILEEYPDDFATLKEAKDLQQLFTNLPQFQPIKEWHRRTAERAHHDTYLDNHFGYRHYFHHVYENRAGVWALGDDGKRSIAFGPQSDASAVQTEFLLGMWRNQLHPWLRLIIHDEIALEVPQNMVQYAVEMAYKVMTAPIPELGGLSFGAEVSVGPSLGEMEVVRT